ncbi:putative vacuolar assembly protein [Microdochium bolleyi]|uniref:Putative vacuolar assembly protein n=1 Tax=Microdochium bolleyi TaxID=196109 RepID=A0A136IYW2_9PEZI|nr:putative vacuolar assembly protein [Microdochium bolleyi]
MTDSDAPEGSSNLQHGTSDAKVSAGAQSETQQDAPAPPPAEEVEGDGAFEDDNSDSDSDSDDDDAEEEEGDDIEEGEDDDEEDEEDEDDEPKLKYARLTQHLSAVYRNGDATSSFLVAGDKMIAGSHDGNIHVVQLPTFHTLRVYHAHSASVTSLSISPHPPPALPSTLKPDALTQVVSESLDKPGAGGRQSHASPSRHARGREPPQVPNVPWNQIYIATSSMDGNVCVQNLVDLKDVSLRNFARPIQSVALSPDYKNDKTYLSGGTAGTLVLTVGAPQGRSSSTTSGGAVAAASGWLGSVGLGGASGKDTVLHSGEGIISTIKWSLTGKYVAWINEHGIKIMRSKLHLDSADAEDAWKRIGHIDRPQTEEWDEMAGSWKGRAEWIDEQSVAPDDDSEAPGAGVSATSAAATSLKSQALKGDKQIERLLVGWGGTIWIIHVHPGGPGVGKHAGERSAGRAEIVKLLRMDCIISGISLYTQNLLLVLAYCKADDAEAKTVAKGHKSTDSTASNRSEPSGGIRHRQNALPPELRLIDLTSQAEVDKDSLTVSRLERLSSNDYHLGVLPANKAASVVASRGMLEAMTGFGTDMLSAAINPRALFSSGASVRSKDSNDASSATKVPSVAGSIRGGRPPTQAVHPSLAKPGAKIFIHSPYDCILATKRDLGDHLGWLLEHHQWQEAWELLDEHPEIMASPPENLAELIPTSSPDRGRLPTDDSFDDASTVADTQDAKHTAAAQKEKRRIGDLWVQDLVSEKEWSRAAEIVSKVVDTPSQWERWIYTFAGAKRFDEIVLYMPSEPTHPPIPGTVYEVVLGHYVQQDRLRLKELLDRWDFRLFDIGEVTTALENQLQYRDVREDSVEGGEKGRDWRIVMESLAKLHEAAARYKKALKCYIRLHDADSSMRLIRDYHLADSVTDDVASFIGLRVPDGKLSRMSVTDLDEATSEAITLLVDEAQRGLIPPVVVVRQLEQKQLNAYLYFYFRGLWQQHREQPLDESMSLVDDFADLVVRVFVLFKDRDLLMDFLRVSTSYKFESAVQECENANYIPELVYLYSKTGQVKRALYLIIDRLGDVSQAISFAKEQDDPDLWEDLLEYSMDKPRFIRGLLEEVGTAINPIRLVRRIPEGLEIPGLREGLKHIMKEHEIQHSISSGVARVLRSEVAVAQTQLRNGQRKGIKFEAREVAGPNAEEDTRGECASCKVAFTEWESETLVGFACGHVFHVTHLLEELHPGEPMDPGMVGSSGEEDRSRGGRFIGSKVTRTRLLRDRIERGCPVCEGKLAAAQGA